MGYAVFHRNASGAPQLDDVASLDAAVERVEHLRNEDQVSDVRVFREVPIEVRTYYKVVVTDDETTPAEPTVAATTTPSVPEVLAAVDASDAQPEPAGPAPTPRPAAVTSAPVEPPPGAFPLSAAPVPQVEVHEAELDAATAEPVRRPSLFGRGG